MADSGAINHATRRGSGKWFARLARSRWSYYVLLFFGLAVILAAAAQRYHAIDRELTEVALSRRVAVAQLAAATLAEKFGRLTDVAVALATRVRFRELVAAGRWDEAAEIVRGVPRDLPFIERLFLTDVHGTLMADVPELPGVRGMNFADRDWYKGMGRGGGPFISPVYKRAAAPRFNVLAVATAVRDAGGNVSGILVFQVQPEILFEWVKNIEVGPGGFVLVIDSKDQIAFHSRRPGTQEIASLSGSAVAWKLRAGKGGVEIGLDPAEREDLISAYADVPGYGWGVLTQQPVKVASGLVVRDQQLRQLVIAFGLVVVLFGSVLFLVSRIAEERERAAALRRESEELARANRSLKMLSECNQALVRAVTEPDLLEVICRNIVHFGGYKLAWVGYAEQDDEKTIRPVARAGADDGYVDALRVSWADTELGRGPTGTAIRTGSPVVNNDAMANPAFAAWRDAALARGYASSVALPLVIEGRAIGALSIYAGEPDAFHDAEVALLVELANDLAYGVNALRTRAAHAAAEEEIRVLNAGLEHRVAERTEQLSESEERHRAIVDTAVDAIIVIDERGAIQRFNPGAERMFGYPEGEVAGKNVSMLMPSPHREQHDGYLARFLATGEKRIIGIGREVIARRKDGTEFPVHLAVAEMRRGESRMFTGIIRDITEAKRAAERQAHLVTSLEATNKELESFSYSVSHDLRSPLRAIDGFSRILTEDYGDKLDDEGRRQVKVIRSESQRLGQLIDDLLEYSRLSRKAVSTSEINMKHLVEEALKELQAAGGRWPELVLEALPPARGDATLVKQAWVNLLGNAIKFSSKRDQAIIEVTGRETDAECMYCVKDNGAGFDMRYYDKLFGVFQRLHSVEEFEGTGVGLAIVHRVVTRHGGRVWAEGKVDEGAAFYFALPKEGGA